MYTEQYKLLFFNMEPGCGFVLGIVLNCAFFTQVLGNRGREFVFGLMESYPSNYSMYFVATSDQPANVTVSSPHIQMNTAYQTTGGFLSVNLSRALYHEEAGQKRGKGISVKADVDISLYVMSDIFGACETFMVLPVPELGKRYLVGMYSPEYTLNDASEILIVSRYNDTSINITLRVNGYVLLDGVTYSNGHVYSLEMSEFETFLLQTKQDLTGTEIQSNNPVVVLSGNKCTAGKYGEFCDHVVEQIPPVDSLGTDFIALSFNSSAVSFSTFFKAVSVDDNTEVYLHGERRFVLNTGKYAEYEFFNPISIRASKPILLLEMAQMQSGGKLRGNGDPFMIVLPSFSQFSTYYIFSLPASGSALNIFTEEYIVVTIESVNQHGILLDGSNVTATYAYKVTGPDGLTNFSILIYKVYTAGRHNLQHTSSAVKFGAVLYGARRDRSYGHPLGIIINNKDVKKMSATFEICTQSERNPSSPETSGSTEELIVLRAAVGSLAGLLVICVLSILCFIRKNRRKKNKKEEQGANPKTIEDETKDYEMNTERENNAEAFSTTHTNTAFNGSRSDEHEYTEIY